MNSIKYVLAGLVAAGLTVSSYAQEITVDWGAGASTFITDSTGAANYLSGDLIEIGTFASAPTVGSSSLSGFSVYASATDDADGAFSESSSATPGAFAHTQIYFVAFNAPTAGAATQKLIWEVPDGSAPNWKFPASTDVPSSTTIDIGDGFAGGGGSANPSTGVLVFGGTGVDTSGPYSLLETAGVPEPSSIALVVLGLMGSIGMIRRRRS